MIDRVIGIVGIALAIATAFLPDYLSHLPKWVAPAGFGIAILLIGLSAGLLAAGGLRRKRTVAKSASLRLHVFGDHRTPQRIAYQNIFRWFYLQTEISAVGPAGRQKMGLLATLFATFEDDVVIHTLTVRSPDMQLPIYEVKEFNQRYAIIQFMDNVPAGTLEIEVSQ
jgi:hypothetical protein